MNKLLLDAANLVNRGSTNLSELTLADIGDADALRAAASSLRDSGHGHLVTYSPKVFVPLTHLCRDVCHYCTFAQTPAQAAAAFLSPEQVLAIARAGARKGCHEVLFTLGDKPELRYPAAREALDKLGHGTTIDYLEAMCRLVLEQTGLLPHVNPGIVTGGQLDRLRAVSVSQGLMLESTSPRLCEKGQPHHGSPDKDPAARLEVLELAGERRIPFTTGILIGIGETREERLEALRAIRDIHDRHGHIQEVIIQAFQPKPGTKMVNHAPPGFDDLMWTVAAARLLLGPEMNIQAPPNLSAGTYPDLISAGINDWGGISPVTPDFVNPEAPWPEIGRLREGTESKGKILAPRLALYPEYVRDLGKWTDAALRPHVLKRLDAAGLARDGVWITGQPGIGDAEQAVLRRPAPQGVGGIDAILGKPMAGNALQEEDIVRLFQARDGEAGAVMDAADRLRAETVGQDVTYVVNRNINYTNVCGYGCRFCAFSKGRGSDSLRGRPYDLTLEEIVRRSVEARQRGATEVCLQGGIHPDYTGKTYLAILNAIKEAVPEIHVHAFSPLEIFTGAASLGVPLRRFLETLRDAGLGSLPGTAAEILDDKVRQVICPDKLTSAEWLTVMETAHEVGLRTTATIMFGHVDSYRDWARHLLTLRALQEKTGGFTEFVALPFIAREAPFFKQGRARRGPTLREALLMHAAARLVLHPLIPNIQVSWPKMGPQAVALALRAGVNDLGGTLMNESISRAAGSEFGQEMPGTEMARVAAGAGRVVRQRTTLYGEVAEKDRIGDRELPPLQPSIEIAAGKVSNIVVN